LGQSSAVAQENDAARAVRATLSIQRALAELNCKNEGTGKPALAARITIDTGPVVVDMVNFRGIGNDTREFSVSNVLRSHWMRRRIAMRTVSSLLRLKALMPLSVLLCISSSASAQFTAQWPPGSGENYSIATDGTTTILNAPSTNGGFLFLHGNLADPLMSIASDGHILIYNSVEISNVFINPALKATTGSAFPVAGIWGRSTAPSNGVGTRGEASGPSSITHKI
jgi:hypothetical protein